MLRALRQPGSPPLLLLALLGLGGAGSWMLASSARRPPVRAEPAVLAGTAAGAASPAELLAVATVPSREALTERRRGPRAERAVSEEPAAELSAPAKEREFLASFLVLERAQPGALESCAHEVLASDGPNAEKVALLRALVESGSGQAEHWLEHAVLSTPDDSGPHAESVPGFALDTLTRLAREDEFARASLARLAFLERALSLSLRRRSAAAFASTCIGAEFDVLRVRLAHEPDELLVAGVLSALEPRSELPGARRVLAAFPPGSGPQPSATTEDETPDVGHGSTRP